MKVYNISLSDFWSLKLVIIYYWINLLIEFIAGSSKCYSKANSYSLHKGLQ